MKRPLSHIGFSVAITLLVLNLIGNKYVLIIMIGLAVILAASLVLSKFRKALSVPLCVGGALLGCVIFACTYSASVEPQLMLDNKTCNAEFYIVDLAQKNNTQYVYTVKTKKIECDNAPQNIKLRIKSKDKIEAENYQVISGKLKFNKISDNSFDSYGSWSDDIYLSSKLYNYKVKDEYVRSLNSKVLDVRQNIIDTIGTSLLGDSGGLATALLIGDKSNLSKNAYNDFKLAGVTHIMAVSGMHLVVLSSVFVFILKKLRVNQQLRVIIIIPLVLFYIALAGFSKSVIRAGILMIVLLIGELFKRKSDSLNSLGLAVLILCFNPFVVCDVGAVLSVLSTLSLITLYPLLDKWMMKYKILRKPVIKAVSQSICISLSVMLYTLPVLYVFFGYISLASVIANVVLVPIGSMAMILSMLLYVSSFVPFVHPIFVFLTKIVCGLMLKITSILADLPFAIAPLDDNLYVILAAAFLIVGIAFLTGNKRNIKSATILVSLIIAFSVFTPLTFKDNSEKIMICKNNAVLISSEGKTMVTGLKDYDDYYSIQNYLFKNNLNCDIIVLSNSFEDNKYNIMLAHKFNPEIIVSFGDEMSLYQMPRTQVLDGTKEDVFFNENIKVDYLDDDGHFYDVKINGFTISNSKYSNCDIAVSNKFVRDCNGCIDLSQSNVVYCLGDNKTFSVRRVD